jgi:hypothetical protein
MSRATPFLPAVPFLLALGAASVLWAQVTEPPQDDLPRYTLRYRFHPGETVRWEVVHRKKVDTTVSGTSQTTETFSKSVKVWQVGQVEADGTATFEQSVEDVDMRHKMGDLDEVRYNSQTDQQPPLGYEHLAESLGVVFSVVTMNAQGEIVNRRWKPVKAAAQSEGQITIPFPQEPVPVGHTWSRPHMVEVKTNAGTVKKVKTRQKFTLENVKMGVATIAVATQSRGTVKFDIDAGRILSQQMDVDRQVVGHPNSASSFHYLTRFTERLLPPDLQTAAR